MILVLVLIFTAFSGLKISAQTYDSIQQNKLESMQPKEQLLVVDKIGQCGDDGGKKAFWCKKAYINCYELLRNFDSNLKRDDVDRANTEDIRKWYCNALRTVGLNFSESKTKAARLITD